MCNYDDYKYSINMNLLLFYGEKDYVGDKKTESILSWDSEGNLHVTALLQKYYSEKEISL